jgi:hypothetical protein
MLPAEGAEVRTRRIQRGPLPYGGMRRCVPPPPRPRMIFSSQSAKRSEGEESTDGRPLPREEELGGQTLVSG